MVLFNDMDGYKKPTVFGKIMKWGFRILIVVICLFLFFIGSLNLLQGTGDAQRNGLASAIGELSSSKVDIGILQTFKLFPQLIIDAQNIRFEEFETGKPKVLLDDFHFEGPGSVVFTKSSIFNDIRLLNMRFLQNGLTALSVDRADVKQIDEDQNHLSVTGTFGDESYELMMPLESWVSKRDDNRYFKFQDGFPFVFKMADTNIQGALVANDDGQMIVFAKGTFAGEKTECVLAKPETLWLGLNLNDFYMVESDSNIVTGQTQVRPNAGIVILGDETADMEKVTYDFSAIDEACKP